MKHLHQKVVAIAIVYVAERAVKFVPIEANKPKITLTASTKLTEGDVKDSHNKAPIRKPYCKLQIPMSATMSV